MSFVECLIGQRTRRHSCALASLLVDVGIRRLVLCATVLPDRRVMEKESYSLKWL